MKLSTILFGIFLIAAVFGGFYGLVGDLASPQGYDVTIDDSYQDTFDQTADISGNLSVTYNKIRNLSTEKGANINIITLVPDVLSIIKDMVVWPFVALNNIFSGLFELFGMPDWIQLIITSLITLTLILIFIKVVLRFTEI